MKGSIKTRPSFDELLVGIDRADKNMLAKAITLIESKKTEDQKLSGRLIDSILPRTGNSIRIGITGIPGAGKSTFIESFGKFLTHRGKKIAILTVDPTSSLSGGSILGDKTRMTELAKDPLAFIRPSPSGHGHGGVASKTRETILLLEAGGYEVVIVETVGVGQSETEVRNMVDFFLLIVLSGGGDDLQGMKRGIIEMTDCVVVNKADGDRIREAEKTRALYENVFHLLPPTVSGWKVPSVTASSIENKGTGDVWSLIEEYVRYTRENKYFGENRQRQQVKWMLELINERLRNDFFHSPGKQKKIEDLKQKVASGQLSARGAVDELFEK